MKTNGIIERERSEGSLEARTKSETPSESSGAKSPSKDNLVSLADYKKKKQTEQEVKQVFKQSLDNDQVMKRYNINQPTIEERAEKIKQGIERINKLMEQIKETNR